MTWQIWLSLAVSLSSIGIITARYLRSHLSTSQLIFWQYLGSVITAIVLIIFLATPLLINSTFLYAILAGALYGIGAIAFFKAVGYNLSKTTAIFSFRSHLSLLLFSIFMKEYVLFNPQTPKGLVRFTAIILASIAILLILNQQKKSTSKTNSPWKLPAIIAVIIFGFAHFIGKILVKDLLPVQALLGQYIGSLSLVSIVVSLKKTKLLYSAKYITINLLRGTVFALAWFTTYHALTTGPGSLIVLIQAAGTMVIPGLFGLLIFAEHQYMNQKNYLGLFLAIISIALLAS